MSVDDKNSSNSLAEQQPVEDFNYRKMLLHPLFLLPLLAGVLITLFVQEDVFQNYPLLADFYTSIKIWFPLIENHAQYSTFPNVTRLYFAINWLLLPAQVFIVTSCLAPYMHAKTKIKTGDLFPGKTIGIPNKYFLPAMLPILTVVMFGSAFYLGKDPSFCSGCINNSKIGMLFMWNVLFPLSFGGMIAMHIVLFKNFRRFYFR